MLLDRRSIIVKNSTIATPLGEHWCSDNARWLPSVSGASRHPATSNLVRIRESGGDAGPVRKAQLGDDWAGRAPLARIRVRLRGS